MTSFYQILDKHTIVDVFCSKWTSHCISQLRVRLRCNISLRNPFTQSKSAVVYMYRQIFSLVLLLSLIAIHVKVDIISFIIDQIQSCCMKSFEGLSNKILKPYEILNFCLNTILNNYHKCTHIHIILTVNYSIYHACKYISS